MLPVAILAGGLATRLRPLTETIPKAMVEVNGDPFAFHQLRLLRRHGVDQVVYCVGYRGEQLVGAVGDGTRFGLQVRYSFDGPALLGTGGALKVASPLLGKDFFVLYGDSFLDCDYAAVESSYRQTGKPALMAVFRNEGRWDTSNVEFDGERIISYSKAHRTARMRHIDYGLAVLASSVLDNVPTDRPTDLATIYEQLVASNDLAAFEVSQRFYEVGSLAGLVQFEDYLKKAEPR
jgi:NDP-sugar pyrophosphorylase family protein